MTSLRRALFVISIDLEMSWGAVHHGRPHRVEPYLDERDVVADLLGLMEEYGIAATWATVGHLFLNHCTADGGRPHPDVVRPNYAWLDGDWYDLDPVSSLAEAPTWYGADLIAAIRQCRTPQEIGSHSFGHIIAGDPGCTAEAFRSDLVAARGVAREAGLELRSYVYPRNSIGHLDLLAEAGFAAFRGPTPDRFAGWEGVSHRGASLVDRVWPLSTATVHPVEHAGMVDVPQTYLFDPDSRTADRVGTKVWSGLVRRRLRHAVKTSSLFHMWFHTHNLATNPARARAGLTALFREARSAIDRGALENLTMGQVADRMGESHAER